MKKVVIAALVAVSSVLLVHFTLYPFRKANGSALAPTPTIILSGVLTGTGGPCHSIYGLPDSKCTPGSIDPRVTQANIHQTICVKGYTATVRPPVTYTEPLKAKSIKAYGYTDTKLGDYEFDHLIPLELGGNPTDIKNLWAEFGHSPNTKDGIESLLRSRVCSGQMTLKDARNQISSNWRAIK